MRPRRITRWFLWVAAAVCLIPGIVRPADAQARQRSSISAMLRVNQQTLSGRPAMVSAIRDGRIVEQQESGLTTTAALHGDSILAGVYDVRVEGEGLVTEVKRGVHLFGGQNTELVFDIRPGKGVHIVEYATGGLSREEIAARLSKLESQVAELEKARVQKQSTP